LPCETVVKVVGEFDSDVIHGAVPELDLSWKGTE
jgi:hypothetical protein